LVSHRAMVKIAVRVRVGISLVISIVAVGGNI